MGFVVFAIVLILITILNTNYVIEKSYTNQDLRYDLNYALYSASLADKDGNVSDFISFIKKGSLGLNLLLIQGGKIKEKHPESFFLQPDSFYVSFTDSLSHPYSSYSDFESLVSLLGYPETFLPEGVVEISSGSWLQKNGFEYAADFIQTKNGSFMYIIASEPFEEVGFFSSLGQGFLVGVLAILVFITSIYYYIRLRLKPIKLMKNRVLALQKGDLDSKIEILGTDELAELSITFNKLISEIKTLIDQKHRLLLDVSHELKTPLTRMRLMVEMIPKNKKTSELKHEINFLNDLISNLLLSDKLSVPYSVLSYKKTSVVDFLESVIDFFSLEEQKRIEIVYKDSFQKISIDKTKMTVAIKNLLQNSFKYGNTKKGSQIHVDSTKEFLYIKIRDFGKGIPSKDRNKIFDPFFRSEGAQKSSGFGLGLSISKKIVESHEGSLSLSPQTNKGAEFVIRLPFIRKNDK